MKNVAFLVGKDTERGSVWMKKAVAENLAWQQEMNKVTNRHGETQPSNAGEDGVAKTEAGYTWTQDGDEVEVVVKNCENKRKVSCSFKTGGLKVSYDGKERVSIDLYSKVDVDGCTWTVSGGGDLVVTLEKLDGGISWPRISR